MEVVVGDNLQLGEDASDIQDILGTDSWAFLENVGNESYYESDLFPSLTLPERLLSNVASILGPVYAEDLALKWRQLFVSTEEERQEDGVTNEESRCIDYFIKVRNIICELYSYDEEGTIASAYLDGHYFGSVAFFQGEYSMFQGITKSLVYAFIAYFYPELAPSTKLNSILIPFLEDYARSRGVHRLYVAPIGKQEQILKKYYGFHECAPIPRFPSPLILGSPESGVPAANFLCKDL